MEQDILDQVKRIHFASIGGSGMCPLTETLHHEGFKLAGSDINGSDTLDRIRSYGIPVSMGHKAKSIDDAQLLVHTAAVKHDNPELIAAGERGVPVVERSVMLRIVTCRYENFIAVPGIHGKTTTTTIITQACTDDGVDSSAIIDGKLPAIGKNGRAGKNQTIVCEACEYTDTFPQLTPVTSVILDIDADHPDYFGTLENITKSFHQSSLQISRLLVISDDGPNCRKTMEGIQNARIAMPDMNLDNDYAAGGISDLSKVCGSFSVYKHGEKLSDTTLSVPGEHSIMNALVVTAVSDYLGIDLRAAAESLGRFTDVHRRFEILGKFDGVTVTSDFAHRPTELTAMLMVVSRMGFHAVWAPSQPHIYSRTYPLLDDFAEVLSIPEHVVLSPILAVREINAYRIYSKNLTEEVPGSVCLSSFEGMAGYAMSHAQPGDLILTLGGGSIYKYANLVVEKCRKKDSLLEAQQLLENFLRT